MLRFLVSIFLSLACIFTKSRGRGAKVVILLLPFVAGCGDYTPSFMDGQELERYRLVQGPYRPTGQPLFYMFPESRGGNVDDGYEVPLAYNRIWEGKPEGAVVCRPPGYRMWNKAEYAKVTGRTGESFYLGYEDDYYKDRTNQCNSQAAPQATTPSSQLTPIVSNSAVPDRSPRSTSTRTESTGKSGETPVSVTHVEKSASPATETMTVQPPPMTVPVPHTQQPRPQIDVKVTEPAPATAAEAPAKPKTQLPDPN